MSLLKIYKASRKKAWLRKLRNSYFTPRFLYPYIYPVRRWADILQKADNSTQRNPRNSKPKSRFVSFLDRAFWFIPNDEKDIQPWLAADIGDTKEYTKYIKKGAGDEMFCNLVEIYCIDKSSNMLELGSNVGRIINELVDRGYTNISGVELNRNAVEASASIFNREISNRIERNSIQSYLVDARDGEFQYVITFGATIELIHPAFDVIRHMCRVAGDTIVIYVNENEHSYPRFYCMEFERWGFYTAYYQRAIGDVCGVNTQNSLIVFKRI